MALDLSAILRQFPILDQTIDGNPLIYLDHAATSQKPTAVLEAMDQFYRHDNANAHRSMHVLAERATIAYEDARSTVSRFIGAKRPEEIIFAKNCTEAINLVAKSWGKKNLKKGDCVALSILEHHSNIVPWLQLKEEIGIELEWIDIDDEGRLQMDQFQKILESGSVRLVAITGQSNVIGVRPPLAEIIKMAHANGALVLVDAAQFIVHARIDVTALDCDFLAFSGHKLYGPTGIGVLYGKQKILESMPPFLGGGMMIHTVEQDRFTAADIPSRFEAGTQPIAEAVGLKTAIDWLCQFDAKDIEAHERSLIEEAYKTLSSIKGLKILGPQNPSEAFGCVSFVIDGIHPHDLTEMVGRQGLCLRAGHHCAQPLHRRLGFVASTRMSMGLYNNPLRIPSVGSIITTSLSRWGGS